MDKWITFASYAIVMTVAVAGFGTLILHVLAGIYGFAKHGRPGGVVIFVGAVVLNIAAFIEVVAAAGGAALLISLCRQYDRTGKNGTELIVLSVIMLFGALVVLCLQAWYNKRAIKKRGWISGRTLA